MPLENGQKYLGNIGTGNELIESGRGSLGYQINILCEHGNISHTIWLTEKNRDRAIKDFETLGIPPEKLRDERFVQFELSSAIAGRRIKFGVKEEEYNGKTTMKVAWINKPGADGNAAKTMAGFFAADTAPPEQPAGSPITDEDIPF